jgi:hypothetical protein
MSARARTPSVSGGPRASKEALPEWESRRAGLLDRSEEAPARFLAVVVQLTTRRVAQVG